MALRVALAVALCAARANASGSFVDVTAQAGLAGYVQHAQNPPGSCILGAFQCAERMTGGAAVADYDGEGWPNHPSLARSAPHPTALALWVLLENLEPEAPRVTWIP